MSKSSLFDRRGILKLGATGLMASHLINMRALGQTGRAPPRRVILFHLSEGLNWRYWLANSMHSGAMAGKSGEKSLLEVVGDTERSDRSMWSHFQQTYTDPDGKNPVSNLLSDINLIDGVSNLGNGGEEQGAESHHVGTLSFKAGTLWNDEKAVTTFGGYNETIDHLISRSWFANGKPPSVIANALEMIYVSTGYTYRGSINLSGDSATVQARNDVNGGVIRASDVWDKLFNGFTARNETGASGPSAANAELRRRFERMKRRNVVTSEEVAAIKSKLGSEEARTLDSYLQALTVAENRLKDQVALSDSPIITGGQCRVPAKRPQLYDRGRLLDLNNTIAEQVALAMACDRVRMVTISLFPTNASAATIIPGFGGDHHNGVGHTQPRTPAAFWDTRYNVQSIHVKALAQLIAALKRIPEGNGTLLDSTTILVHSEHSGESHKTQIPHFALMAGGGGIKADGNKHYKTGRYIKLAYSKNGESFSGLRAANDFVLSLAHGAGVTKAVDNKGTLRELDSFGHASLNKGPVISG